MDFFQQLSGISENLDLTIRIKGKNGKLTVSVHPDHIKDIQPLITTGTPEALDAGFIDAIRKPIADAQLVVVNEPDFNKDVEESKKAPAKPKPAAQAKPAKKAAKPPKPEKPTKPAKPKPEPKAAPKQEAPKLPQGPTQLLIE